MTTQDDLDQINAAIKTIETGSQEYSIGNRKFKRADYRALCAERDRINQQLFADNNSGIGISTYVANFERR